MTQSQSTRQVAVPGLARMISGTAFVYAGASHWFRSPDDEWAIETYSPEADGEATHIGRRKIDGTLCNVFRTSDRLIYAQTALGV